MTPGVLEIDEACRVALAHGHRLCRTPVFIGDAEPFVARVLAQQYMEFLKAPAFVARFPEFTHDFLWSFRGPFVDRFDCVRVGWASAPSDDRVEQTLRRLSRDGRNPPEIRISSPDGVDDFAAVAFYHIVAFYNDFAVEIGVDPEIELSW